MTTDELTADHVARLADKVLSDCGWIPGDRMSFHSVRELLIRFGAEVVSADLDRCGHPSCGCDFDAVCNVALSGGSDDTR